MTDKKYRQCLLPVTAPVEAEYIIMRSFSCRRNIIEIRFDKYFNISLLCRQSMQSPVNNRGERSVKTGNKIMKIMQIVPAEKNGTPGKAGVLRRLMSLIPVCKYSRKRLPVKQGGKISFCIEISFQYRCRGKSGFDKQQK